MTEKYTASDLYQIDNYWVHPDFHEAMTEEEMDALVRKIKANPLAMKLLEDAIWETTTPLKGWAKFQAFLEKLRKEEKSK